MNWKELYTRFKQWQINPYEYRPYGNETHRCSNCGEEFRGHYCPMCSQRTELGRVNWNSVRHGVMDIWGVGNRSLPYSLWQLLWRPGYFISDYINGKRQISFPPVKMLIIVSIIVMMVGYWTGYLEQDLSDVPNTFYIRDILNWTIKNIGWTTLIVNSFLILPTYATFHYSPRNTAHLLPAGFFIQVFTSTIMLLFSLFHLTGFILTPIYFFFTYLQLFGYRIWGTLWRLAICFLEGIMLLTIPIIAIVAYYEHKPLSTIFFVSIKILALVTVIFLLTHFINRRGYRKRMAASQQHVPTPEPKLTDGD